MARDDCHILRAVDGVGDRAVDDLAAQTRFPQLRAGDCIKRVEVTLATTGEQQVRGRRQDAAVGDVLLLESPLAFTGVGVERDDGTVANGIGPVVDRGLASKPLAQFTFTKGVPCRKRPLVRSST